jgi:hypothetical protein
MTGIWSWVYQLVLLLVATFVFMVLLGHGPSNFVQNAGDEMGQLMNLVHGGDKVLPSTK